MCGSDDKISKIFEQDTEITVYCSDKCADKEETGMARENKILYGNKVKLNSKC